MANRTELAEIPLAGKGLVFKPRGNYEPGEFRKLNNCEIMNDGTIRNRRPIKAIYQDNAELAAVTPYLNRSNGFIGSYRDGMVTGGKYTHSWVWPCPVGAGNSVTPLWDPLVMNTVGHSLDAPTNATIIADVRYDKRQIVAYFFYNKVHYWVVQSFISKLAGSGYSKTYYHLMYVSDASLDAAHGFGGIASAYDITMLSKVQIAAIDTQRVTAGIAKNTPLGSYAFRNCFVHKERTFVVTQKAIYFSKATDPTVWTISAGNGGFFGFSEDIDINCVVPHRDSLYVICDNSTYVITYNNDPNVDAVIRKLTDGLGGDHAVLYGDTVYFARDHSLYSITDQTVEEVADLNFYDASNPFAADNYFWRLRAFDDYIVAMRGTWYRPVDNTIPVAITDGSYIEDYGNWDQLEAAWSTFTEGTSALDNFDYASSVFFLNMKNGAVHSFDSAARGYVSDMYWCPVEGKDNQQRLYIMYSYSTTPTVPSGRVGNYIHYMNSGSMDLAANTISDIVNRTSSTMLETGIRFDLEVDSYTPDGAEFFIKKYRSVMLQGEFPKNLKVSVRYDSQVGYTVLADLTNAVNIALQKPPWPVRFGLSQRARSLTIRMCKPWADVIAAPDNIVELSHFSLAQMAVAWSPTGRMPLNRSYQVTQQ